MASASRSQTTPLGCQNAPTRFLPPSPSADPAGSRRSCRRWRRRPCRAAWSLTCTTGMPRCHAAAAKPATSVTMPPPTPITTSLRVRPMRANPRHSDLDGGERLVLLALPISNTLEGDARVDLERDARLRDDRGPASRRGSSDGELAARRRGRRARRSCARRAAPAR